MENIIQFQSLANCDQFEMVERKGKGHPDSICDHIAEEISKALCRYYLQEFGMVLHHNVVKALLVGASALIQFGARKITKPIELILAGLATHEALRKQNSGRTNYNRNFKKMVSGKYSLPQRKRYQYQF